MRKCRKASVKETLVFQHKYCASAETRETLVHHFMVTVDYDTCIECVKNKGL